MKNLAVFDVDDTIIDGQTQRLFLDYLHRHKLISHAYYMRLLLWFILYKIGLIRSPEKIMNSAFLFLAGMNVRTLSVITDNFYEEVLKSKIFSGAIREINKCASDGDDVILLSNAVHPIIEKISKELNITSFISTRLAVENSTYTGHIDGFAVYGGNKVARLKSYLENKKYDKIYGYGDHYSDYDFLNFVNVAHIINPNKSMRKIAHMHNWKILNFT